MNSQKLKLLTTDYTDHTDKLLKNQKHLSDLSVKSVAKKTFFESIKG